MPNDRNWTEELIVVEHVAHDATIIIELVIKETNYFYAMGHTQCDHWPVKSSQMSSELPKNDFTWKMIDFDTFTKIPKNVVDLGKLNVVKGFKKLPNVQ